VKPFFAHALLATLSVIFVPLIVVFGLMASLETFPIVLAAVLGVVLAITMMVIGSVLWARRSEASDIGFSDLMLWRWIRRRRAEEDLAHGARLLGLDRSGQPIDAVRISPEQQLQVLKDLTAALESKDPYTHGHSQRVERHSYRTAAEMGLSAEDIEDLRKAAALHDVGKIRVPDRILRKAGPLTPEERTIVEEHAVVGAWMVSSVGNADVIAAVRHHHERWDGAGYPDGMSGSDIPLFARLISVADAYDAITSTRPYRASSGRDEAVDALRAGAGTHFDPEVVEMFIQSLPSRVPLAAGLFVILGGPGRLFREIAMWFRRLGAGSLTPAVGATGAAIVLGASMFTPSIVSPEPTFEGVAAVDNNDDDASDSDVVLDNDKDDDGGDQVKGKQVRSNGGKSDEKKNAGDKSDGRRGPGPEVKADIETNNGGNSLGGNGNGGNGNGGNGGSNNGGGGNNPPTPPGNGGGEPSPGPTQEPPPTQPPPTEEPSEDGENQNDGKDGCPEDGNAGHGNDDC
jgi:putative nucleotidyltransferase with HDIG domain